MKKIFLLAIVSLLFITDTYAFQCDQTFNWKLRYWYQYTFYDDFSNTWTPKWINSVDVNYIEQQDYNGSSSFPSFAWTPWIISKWYILNSGDSWTVIRASSTYPINYHPTARNSNNFVIQYKAKYYEQINWVWDMANPKYHTECKNYEITWCWDWVLDSDEWEICDPNDPNKAGWGTWGCNVATCQPITTPNPPTCNSLWMNPTTWSSPLASNVSCLGTNANKYTINCWNGQTIDWSSGTCNYTWTGTFTSTCYVNDTITSAACQRTVTVTAPVPSCTSLAATPTTWINSLSSNVTCTWIAANKYTINCWNWQVINANTGTCNYATVWTYTPTCYVNDTITSAACQQTVTVTNSTTTPSCTNLTATPATWTNSLSSSVACTWVNATTYRINCWNGQVINASTGTCNYATVWTYTPTCFVNDTITSASCQKTVSVTTSSSSSSSSSWWDTYQCRDIEKTWNQITCTWNANVETFRLSCSWTYMFRPAVANWSTNTTSATFTCNDSSATCSVYDRAVTESAGYSWRTNLACNLTPTSSSSSWGSSSSSWGSSKDYCWDWVVQRPNENFQLEECDFGNWTWPAWCTTSCKINWINSIPNDWEIVFWPSDNVIIWNGMNPYVEYSLSRPSITNKSPYDLYFDSLCVVKKSWTTLNWSTTCQPIWKTLFPGSSFSLTNYPNFVWNTNSLTAWTFGDNTVVTTIEHEGTLYTNAYFASELKVRVSKPSIATTGWGTSFIASTSNIANVSEVTQITWNNDKNKNFVWAWVSTWDISSYSKDVTDTTSVNSISQEWTKYNQAVNETSNITGLSVGSTSNLADFDNYNWISNAFIIRNTNFVVTTSTFAWLTWPRTYIIENWDLIINGDINYSSNIAFVVKWGNIQIDKWVDTITWTYISIPDWSLGWDIKWINWSTNDVLTVKWSLYWNLENLVSQRTYVKENSSGLLSVWTVVSFGSSVFRDPAPLTSTFINEYLDAVKVSK